MVQTHVELTEEQAAALERLAKRRGTSVSRLVQEGVQQVLRDNGELSWEERWERAQAFVGAFAGPPDLAARHDDYLVEAIEDDHVRGHKRNPGSGEPG